MAWSDVLKAVIPIVVACIAWLLGQVRVKLLEEREKFLKGAK